VKYNIVRRCVEKLADGGEILINAWAVFYLAGILTRP
jgi:hypothetical protein